MIDADKVRRCISADDWLAILYADDDGPLPTCCANISALREAVAALLSPIISPPDAARALLAWGDAQAGHWDGSSVNDDPIFVLMATLQAEFDANGDPALLTHEGLRAWEDKFARWEVEHGFASPEPEIRGYVVLIPTRSGTFEVGATGTVFPDAHPAAVEANWADEQFGLTGAHVGVVTALPEG